MTLNTNPKKLMNTLRPLMFLSQVMGVTFPPNVERKRLRLIVTYRVIIYAALVLALIREIPTIMFWSRNLVGVHGMLAFIETRLRWFAVFCNFLLTTCNNKNINNCLSILLNNPLTLKQNEYNYILKTELCVLIITTVVMICYVSLGHDFLWTNPYHSWYTSSIYLVTEFYIGFSNLQFIIILIVIKKYFEALNNNIKKSDFRPETTGKGEAFTFFLAKEHKQDNVKEIVKFREIHMNLTTACLKTNECFNLQILLFLMLSLIEVTYSLRGITVYAIRPNTGDINKWNINPTMEGLLILAWGGYYLGSVLQIICSCEVTMAEAKKTCGIIHKLINTTEDKEVEEQIFSLQLMNYKVFFSAGKFVSLNYPLLNSIIGTIITYLVIIMTLST